MLTPFTLMLILVGDLRLRATRAAHALRQLGFDDVLSLGRARL